MVRNVANIKNFFQKWRLAIAWTVGYVALMWAILRGLFNFNMLSLAHWEKLSHVELHGFPGFVFAILLLAAIPLYIATVALTVRKNEVPVKIPVPKCFVKPPKPEPKPPIPVVTPGEVLEDLPAGVPAEMREIYARAHKNKSVRQMSVFNRPSKFDDSPVATTVKTETTPGPMMTPPPSVPMASVPAVQTQDSTEPVSDMESDFPIPADFDVQVQKDFDVPVFSDIKFDDDDEEDDKESEKTEKTEKAEYASIQDIISGAGHSSEVVGNLIVVNNCAVAVHADDDFWVADELDWFASGRQKPSPIAELNNIATEKGLKPILYLGQTNIMDFDKVSEQWRAEGIQIVTSTDELLKLIQTSPK